MVTEKRLKKDEMLIKNDDDKKNVDEKMQTKKMTTIIWKKF